VNNVTQIAGKTRLALKAVIVFNAGLCDATGPGFRIAEMG
jgi:hypothetical protein